MPAKTRSALPSFKNLLTEKAGERFLNKVFDKKFENNRNDVFDRWYKSTGEAGEVYPSQGLLLTPFDDLEYLGKTMLSDDELWKTLRTRRYLLEIYNHPQRLANLELVENSTPPPVPEVESQVMDYGLFREISFSGWDLGLAVIGSEKRRVSRRKLLENGPFLKIGTKARIPFAGGAMPDIYGAPAALATMAMCHGLANIPRNGAFSKIKRQADLAKATIDWLEDEDILEGRPDKAKLLQRWVHNLVGVIEPNSNTAIERAEALYQVGIRTFRIYSPEPGRDAARTLKKLRDHFDDPVEIFVGQVAQVDQAKMLEAAGANGLYLGIGGGGRCTTAVRSASVVDWPMLLWQLRGQVAIPTLVEGGASEQIGLTLALGGSVIGVSRSAGGGTIESPGGLLYLVTKDKKWFKPYGGEASARTKYQDHKMLACGLPAFIEGETTHAYRSYFSHIMPTMTQSIFYLLEDSILSLVFRGVKSIPELQALDPSPVRRITQAGNYQASSHDSSEKVSFI